jgi:hypothetical protein
LQTEAGRSSKGSSSRIGGSIREQIDDKAQKLIHSEGGVNGRYCVLCKEEGRPNETARDMVTIRPKSGGEQRRVAICSAHLETLGEPSSPYAVSEPTIGPPTRGSPRAHERIQRKSQTGDISRTLRRVERYGRTQRGRLGE